MWCCVSAAGPIHDFTNKNFNIFFLKVRKLDEEVIDIGREFQLFGPMVKDCKLLKICATRMRSIAAGRSGAT